MVSRVWAATSNSRPQTSALFWYAISAMGAGRHERRLTGTKGYATGQPLAPPLSPQEVLLLQRFAVTPGYVPAEGDLRCALHQSQKEIIMGKYVLGWILGVPAIVLVVVYFFFR
jgi:hypothetical protein